MLFCATSENFPKGLELQRRLIPAAGRTSAHSLLFKTKKIKQVFFLSLLVLVKTCFCHKY